MIYRLLSGLVIIFFWMITNISCTDANAMDELLINSAKNNDFAMVKIAINNGANVNYVVKENDKVGDEGYTAMLYAITYFNPEMVEYLIRSGSDVNARLELSRCWGNDIKPVPYQSVTPLICVVDRDRYSFYLTYHWFTNEQIAQQKKDKLKIINMLIDAGADVNGAVVAYNVKNGHPEEGGNTPLITAISGKYFLNDRDVDIIKLLLLKGANINKSNDIGMTPLMAVNKAGGSMEEILNLAKLLLQNGADPSKVDKSGKTALQYAINRNYREMIELLLPISPK